LTCYTIDDLAIMTGLTTRTLRNYIKNGVLRGEKAGGKWRFTLEDYAAFLDDPAVRQTLRARANAVVSDFLADTAKKSDAACVILDFAATDEEGERIADFFCDGANRFAGVKFSYSRRRGVSRVILTGDRARVTELAAAYDAHAGDGKEKTEWN